MTINSYRSTHQLQKGNRIFTEIPSSEIVPVYLIEVKGLVIEVLQDINKSVTIINKSLYLFADFISIVFHLFHNIRISINNIFCVDFKVSWDNSKPINDTAFNRFFFIG